MFISHFGEFAALLTAIFWTITSIAFESASKKIGSLAVNLLRLILAFLFLSIYTFFARGLIFPVDANLHQWIWLALSAIAGFVLGDLFLFKAYSQIGARVSQLIMALAPPIAAVCSYFALGEKLSPLSLLGMVLTLLGISLVVLERKKNEENIENGNRMNMKLSYPLQGLLFALGGAAGQGIGIVLSKYGMGKYDAFAASQIRVLVGGIGFAVLFFVFNRWQFFMTNIKNRQAMKGLVIGSFFGPFLGVSFSLLSVQYTSAGIASTIMAIVPVIIIVPAILIFKEKVTVKEIIGAFISVAGVICFFI